MVELKIDNKKRLYIEENPFFKALQKVNFNKWWSNIIELRTFFENNREYSITELYAEKFNDYYIYKWKPLEYYKKKKEKC